MVKIKGNEIKNPNFKDSYDRRAVKLQNSIVETLKSLDVDRDSTDIPMEKNARLKGKASASWYFEGRNLKYSYSLMPKFIENLYIIDQVLKFEVDKLLGREITLDQFQREFEDDKDLDDDLLNARKVLGASEDETDFEVISKNYKDLAKKHHPDMSDGDHELFQKINVAHKLIKKELT